MDIFYPSEDINRAYRDVKPQRLGISP